MMKAAQSNQGLSNDDQEGRKQIVEPADDKGILKTDIDSEQNKEHNVGRRRIAIGSVIICVLVVTVVGSIVGATVSRKKKEKDEDFLSANSNSLREVPQGIFDTDDEEIPNQKITVSGEVEVIKDDISGSFTEENSTTLPPSNTAADQVWDLLLDNAI